MSKMNTMLDAVTDDLLRKVQEGSANASELALAYKMCQDAGVTIDPDAGAFDDFTKAVQGTQQKLGDEDTSEYAN